jgi:hypothetical protein
MLQNDSVLDSPPSIVNVFSNPDSDHGISDLDYSTLSNNLILKNFCWVGYLNIRLLGYFTSDNVPDGIKNATHNTLSNFRKKLATY